MRWWQIKKRDADLERELQSDLELEEEEQRERGLSAEEARHAAQRAFGNTTLIHEQTRATWSWAWIESFIQDLRYGFRGMRRNAGSTVFAILIVGLGIGGASTVFSVVNALLLRPLPFRDPGQLVWISNAECCSTQVEHYSDLRDENRSFSDLAGWSQDYSAGNMELTGNGEPERFTSVAVTDNLFALLGVEPAVGRSFTKEECQGKYYAPPAVVLSNSFWRRRFASDPSVVGRSLTLNSRLVTVVGILPASFDFAGVFAPGTPVDIFIPWPLADKVKPQGNTMAVIGRLKPGVTIAGAQAELSALAKQLESQHPERNGIQPRLVLLEQHVSGQVRPPLVVLMCSVGVVMLIVCANLSHLQLARMGARQKEMVMRAALGAGRFRLLRQVLTESVTLSCCGAALGLILAVVGTHELAHLHAFNLPLLESIRVDGRTLAFTLLTTVATGVLLASLPRCRFQRASFVKGCRTRDANRVAVAGMDGSAMDWWSLSLPSPACCSSALRCSSRAFCAPSMWTLGFSPSAPMPYGSTPVFRSRPQHKRTHLSMMCCNVPAQSPASRQRGLAMSCRLTAIGRGKSGLQGRSMTRTITLRHTFEW